MSKKTETKRSTGPAGASIVSDDGMKIFRQPDGH